MSDEKIRELEEERSRLFKQKEPIDKRLIDIATELKPLYEERGTRIIKDLRGELDFDLMLAIDHKSMVEHREADRQVQSLGLYRSGYFIATLQSAIKLMLSSKNLQQTYDGVMLLLPHIKQWPKITPYNDQVDKNFHGKKVFEIFEHTLSREGTYFFAITDNGWAEIIRTRFSRTEIIYTSPSIMEGLKYVQKHHYYTPDGEDEE